MCLDAASPQGPVKIVRCHGMGGNQAWVYNDEVRNARIGEKGKKKNHRDITDPHLLSCRPK